MDATFLTTLASYASFQPDFEAIALGGAIAAVIGLLFLGGLELSARRAHSDFPSGMTEAIVGFFVLFVFVASGCAIGSAVSEESADTATPTEAATAAVTDYLADAHHLTVTGAIDLTTGDPEHTDIAHADGRAVANAQTTDGELVEVTVTWNDPSIDPDDNLITVTTRR